MKKIITILIVMACCSMTMAQQQKLRLRTIVFGDTYDRSIGVGVEKNFTHFQMMNDNIAACLDLDEDPVQHVGTECSKEYLMKWLKSFKCNENDIVIFCYLGHGGRSYQDTSKFPQMCLGSDYEDEWVSMEALKKAIMDKGPRMLLMLGDCCNNFSSGVSPKYSLMSYAGNTEVENLEIRNIKELFLNFKGCVIASGCKAGEYSWINTDPSNKSQAGVFLDSFIWNLSHYTRTENGKCDWGTLLKRVSTHVANVDIVDANGQHWRQHPEYRVEPGNGGSKDDVVIDKRSDELKMKLEYIADDRNSKYERVERAELLYKNSFTGNAIVKVVGRDNKTVIQTLSAEDYLNKISLATRLRKVSVLNETRDSNGKITQMTVHETYIKKK